MTVGRTKYPVVDDDGSVKPFICAMIGAARSPEERGLIALISYTGMHPWSYSKPERPDDRRGWKGRPIKLRKQRNGLFVEWERPKTHKALKARIPKEYEADIRAFLSSKPMTRRHYNNVIKAIAEKAGYGDDPSALTFRHCRCILAGEEGYHYQDIHHIMGCSREVVDRNYTKKHEAQLFGEDEE